MKAFGRELHVQSRYNSTKMELGLNDSMCYIYSGFGTMPNINS